MGTDKVLELVDSCNSTTAAAGLRHGFARLAQLRQATGEPPPHPPEAHVALAQLAERFVARLSGQVLNSVLQPKPKFKHAALRTHWAGPAATRLWALARAVVLRRKRLVQWRTLERAHPC